MKTTLVLLLLGCSISCHAQAGESVALRIAEARAKASPQEVYVHNTTVSQTPRVGVYETPGAVQTFRLCQVDPPVPVEKGDTMGWEVYAEGRTTHLVIMRNQSPMWKWVSIASLYGNCLLAWLCLTIFALRKREV